MAKAVHSSLGELSVLAAGVGIIIRTIPMIENADFLSAACLGAATICGAIYVSRKSKFDVLFRNLGLGIDDVAFPLLKRKTRKAGYWLYEFTLPAGLCLEDFIKKQEAIEAYIGSTVELEYGFKNLLVRVYDTEKTRYEYMPIKAKKPLEIPIGYNRSGVMETVDLSSGEPHMYVAGETNSGKSTFLRCAVTNLILNNDVDIWLADLKNGVEFSLFENCSKVKKLAKNPSEALHLLQAVSKEVDGRYDLFLDHRVKDIKQYRAKVGNMKYQIVIVDEFADLMYDPTSQKILQELAAKARACGVHLLLATQRPDAQVLPGRLKANITTILGLKTLNALNANIIGIEGLEDLRGFGHGILKRGFNKTYIQVPLLEPEEAEKLIAPYNIDKTKKVPAVIKDFDCI